MRQFLGSLLLVTAFVLSFACLGLPEAQADSPLPVTEAENRTLVGNAGGAVDTYAFNVPGTVAAPTVTVTFTPSAIVDASGAGFIVFLNGTQVGAGQATATHGVLTYTMPANPSGMAVIQVYSYSAAPVSFTIQTTGVPSNIPNGPAANNATAATAAWINGTLSENLAGSTGGAYGYFTFPSTGSSPPSTVTLTYSPADAQVNQAVGFNVYDEYSNNIASAIQPTSQNQASATLTVDLSRTPGEPLTIQVYNYAPGVTITYHLSVSGIAPAVSIPTSTPGGGAATGSAPQAAAAPPAFQSFWVENFVATPIWSGPDASAVNFGIQPQFSSFLVVRPQSGSRLYVLNPKTQNYGYIDASAVGPSGPPSG